MSARFPWVLTVVCALCVALLATLGVWQVQRLQWKEALIARAVAAAREEPASLDALFREAGDPEFRRVLLPCDFRGRPYVELQSIHEGQAGVRLISECEGWLVDLGFVADTVSARPSDAPPSTVPGGPIPVVVAEVRDTPAPNAMMPGAEGRHFYARDNAAIARMLGASAETSRYTLYATTSGLPDFGALEASAPPPAFSNNHLGYALTWFGLALALIGFYIALLRRALRAPTPPDETEKSAS